MSAYVVNSDTIDAIVSAARQYGRQTGFSFWRPLPDGGFASHRFSRYAADDEAPETFNPDTIGRELWAENLRSVHHRYPDTADGENIPGPIDFSEADAIRYQYGPGSRVADVDPLGALGAIRGYRYQACEHPDYRHSIAEGFIRELETQIIGWLISATGSNAWTVDELGDLTGDTIAYPDDDGWTIRFRRRQSSAVSLLEKIVRGR